MLNLFRWSHIPTAIVLIMIATAVCPTAIAATEIVLEVGDVTALPGQPVEIPIYFTNQTDTVAAFEFWVQLDRPGILRFTSVMTERMDTTWWRCIEMHQQTCYDSTRVPPDSSWDFMHVDTTPIGIGTVNATGALVENWDYLQARSLGSHGQNLSVVGFSEVHEEVRAMGILPQQDGLLVTLMAEVLALPSTQTNRTVNIIVQTSMLDHIGFSDPSGNPLGLSCELVPDTNYWLCQFGANGYCGYWIRVSRPPADSMSIDTVWRCAVDPDAVEVIAGSVTVLNETTYGDADCNGATDIGDLVYFVDYMFRGGPPLPCPLNLECDGDNEVTVTDLICLVDWMFPRH